MHACVVNSEGPWKLKERKKLGAVLDRCREYIQWSIIISGEGLKSLTQGSLAPPISGTQGESSLAVFFCKQDE